MAIFVDASELSRDSRMPQVPGAQVSDCLEAVSGADLMVSTLQMPATTETLVRKHAQGGAIFIQRKSGFDFVSSILDERINVALARMLDIGTVHQYQRCVMATGFFMPETDGAILVGRPEISAEGNTYIHLRRYEPVIQYVSMATIRRRIAMRGGWLLPLTCDREIPGELHNMESDLEYLSAQPTKDLLDLPNLPPDPPDPDDPLQRPVEVRDGRVVLAAFQGVGVGRATSLYKTVKGYNKIGRPPERGFTEADWEPTTLQLLTWAAKSKANVYDFPKIPLWGRGTHDAVRKQLGLYPGQELSVTATLLDETGDDDE